jgi:hypothetical protein
VALVRSWKVESPDVIVMAVHLLRRKADSGGEDADGKLIANLRVIRTSEKGANIQRKFYLALASPRQGVGLNP